MVTVELYYDESNKATYVYSAMLFAGSGSWLLDFAFPTFSQAQAFFSREIEGEWRNGEVNLKSGNSYNAHSAKIVTFIFKDLRKE